ncbi:MAG: sigma 54-interacting transcriptional regulator, partial [Rhodospirillales bacterium]|nr:sigma 54-interacting transcriptional regulator [Rhodospirillales bacterium]
MVSHPELPPLVGESQPFLDLMERVSLAAPQDRPVLVIGERGTGKELIANRLHFLSQRWQGPLVQLNCAALPETLLETELFGHEAGAFTGADKRRAGRFEIAYGGTLFLDEIANATSKAQEKILRVIEYGAFERVGGNETLHVDVRVIGATNADLPSEADEGRFRHDLLDRLSFEVLTIPPLRVRGADIPLLAFHFGRAMAQELDWDGFPGFDKSAAAALSGHAWPGNERELRNVVERAVYLHGRPDAPIEAIQFDPFASPWRPAGRAAAAPKSVGDEKEASSGPSA